VTQQPAGPPPDRPAGGALAAPGITGRLAAVHVGVVALLLALRPVLPVAQQDSSFGVAMIALGASGLVAWRRGRRRPDLPGAWHGVGLLVCAGIGLRGVERLVVIADGAVATPVAALVLPAVALQLWRAFGLRRLSLTDRLDAALVGLGTSVLAWGYLTWTGTTGTRQEVQLVVAATAAALAAAVLLSGRHLRLSRTRVLVVVGLGAQALGVLVWPAPWADGADAGRLVGSSITLIAATCLVLALYRAAAIGAQSSSDGPVVRSDAAWWAPMAAAIVVILVQGLSGLLSSDPPATYRAIIAVIGLILLTRVVTTVRGLQQATRALAADRQRFLEQALTDPLTGLANRAALVQHLRSTIPGARADRPVSVLFCDLDRLKVVNDALGHDVGDDLIRAVADRWRDVVGGEGVLARIGGDEFVVCTDRPQRALALARAMHDALEGPVVVDGAVLSTRTSIGIAATADAGTAVDSLLRDADAAMYRAKAAGGGRTVVFDDGIRAEAMRRMAVEHVVADAVEGGSVDVHLQPIVDLATGRIVVVEALLRLVDHDGQPVDASVAVAVAEEAGLIVRLGDRVLERACAALRGLWDAGHRIPAVAVNTSASQLVAGGFPAHVEAVLARHQLPPSALVIEVTESVLLDVDGPAATALAVLAGRGVGVAMDDFGSGYSSLSHLGRLHLTQLKLDGGFMEGAAGAVTEVVLDGVIRIAHGLGIPVVAEKVEDAEQVLQLRRLGCDMAQGWFFCRALPPAELAAWLTDAGEQGQRSVRSVPTAS
jgi:diguanylate cyclase (GGDEF)-like protein